MQEKTLHMRLATIEDADVLLQWRNDPETRNASFNTEKVLRKNHISWLTETLGNPARKLYIAEKNNTAVGMVRTDLSEDIYELSWTVAPEARGCGVAKQMVRLVAQQISEPIRAEVKVGNEASVRIAQFAGMVFAGETKGIQHFKRAALK